MRISFSSRDLPVADRPALLREVYARSLIGCDLAPLDGAALEVEVDLVALDGCGLGAGRYSALQAVRGAGHITGKGVMLSASTARFHVSLGSGDMLTGGAGAVTVMPLHRASRWAYAAAQQVRSVWVDHAVLSAVAPRLDLDRPRVLARDAPGLGLLFAYAEALHAAPLDPAVGDLAQLHLPDLVAMVLSGHGPGKDGKGDGGGAAGRAARLAAIRRDMARGFRDPDLDIATLARRHRITPRYLQMLFAEMGRTASAELTALRLDAVAARLSDPRRGGEQIGPIAFACGFRDLSTFNRAFRRRFDTTPGQFRSRK